MERKDIVLNLNSIRDTIELHRTDEKWCINLVNSIDNLVERMERDV